jgi:hypothetical protein
MDFTNAENEEGARGCLGGQSERVAERRVWYAVTRASGALESVGVECNFIKYLRLGERGRRVSSFTTVERA